MGLGHRAREDKGNMDEYDLLRFMMIQQCEPQHCYLKDQRGPGEMGQLLIAAAFLGNPDSIGSHNDEH